MWDLNRINELYQRRDKVKAGGGAERIEKQQAAGKLTARARLSILFDEATFFELNDQIESRTSDFDMDSKRVLGDGVITGYGKINGRLAFASSQDFTVNGGSLGEYHAKKICHVMDMAFNMRVPFISINDSGGARIEEGIDALNGYGEIFFRNTRASGIIPQISVIMGPCAGGACYSPAISDFVFIVKNTGLMFITGPNVIKAVTREEVTPQELGGAEMHSKHSGVAHFSFNDDESCLLGVRELLRYLPQNSDEVPPVVGGTPVDLCRGLQEVVTDNKKKCYDMKTVIGSFVDKHSFLEIQREFAMNAIVGLAWIEGSVIGVVANQPNYMGGVLDFHASDKIARFVRFCDCFNIPLLTLVDVPAFLPGKQQEQCGIIRHGAKVLYAYSEAIVPKITLILRKAYGGAYIAMCSKSIGADIVYAWPIAEIAVMGAEGALDIIGGKGVTPTSDREAERKRQIAVYESKYLNPYIAASRGYIDEVIVPGETRARIVCALEMLKSKKTMNTPKKHGNIPL